MVPVTTVRIREVTPSSRRSVVATDPLLRCLTSRSQIGNEISAWQPFGSGADQLAPQRFRLLISGHRLAIDCLEGSATEAVDQQGLIAVLQLSAQRGFPGQPPQQQLCAHHARKTATAEWWCDPFALTQHHEVGTIAATELSTGVAQQCQLGSMVLRFPSGLDRLAVGQVLQRLSRLRSLRCSCVQIQASAGAKQS